MTYHYTSGEYTWMYWSLDVSYTTKTIYAAKETVSRPLQRDAEREIVEAGADDRAVSWDVGRGLNHHVDSLFLVTVDSTGIETVVTGIVEPRVLVEANKDRVGRSPDVTMSKGLFGFSVSADENLFAFASNEGAWIFDRSIGESYPLAVPQDIHVRSPRFSPDGRYLAAVGMGTKKREFVIVIAHAPRFDTLEVFAATTPIRTFSLAWSPDSYWLMGLVLRPEGRFQPQDFIAFEVETGRRVDLFGPYTLESNPDSAVRITGHDFDWTY